MSPAFYLTAIWISITFLVFGIARYYKLPLSKLDKNNILLLALEVLSIALVIYFNSGHISSPYLLFTSIFLILVGWLKSYQNLLLRFSKGIKRRTRLGQINSFIEGSEYSQNIYFLGDWFQIVALALVWNSLPTLIISCLVYPLIVYIFSIISTKNFNKEVTNKSEFIKNKAWIDFIKIASTNVARSLLIILILITPFAIVSRDWVMFFGTPQDAINLITTLAQVEATVFALVITFLFVLVEFTNSTYSPRLAKSFTKQWSFKLMVIVVFISIVTKFILLANVPNYLGIGKLPGDNLPVDVTLFFTVLSVVGYYIFIVDIIKLMQPEEIARQILSGIDSNWMETIRRNWANKWRREGSIFLDDDPMILFERYLASTIERGDLFSTKVALVMMRDKISQFMNKDDGVIIDNYLFSRLGNVVDVLARYQNDMGLGFLCVIIDELTMPSEAVIKTIETSIFDSPPGGQLLRKIAETSIDYHLINSGRTAIYKINYRAEQTISILPDYSELYIFNQQNHDLPQPEIEKLWKNDSRLENYINNYSFFSELGAKAAKGKSADLIWTIAHSVVSQINKVIETIKEERYQSAIILRALFSLDRIVSSACSEKLNGSIGIGLISYGKHEHVTENIARLLVQYCLKFVEELARAGILEASTIIDITLLVLKFNVEYPELAIQTINIFGSVGEVLTNDNNYLSKDKREYMIFEINRRIDQVRPHTLDRELNARIEDAVILAKKKLNKE